MRQVQNSELRHVLWEFALFHFHKVTSYGRMGSIAVSGSAIWSKVVQFARTLCELRCVHLLGVIRQQSLIHTRGKGCRWRIGFWMKDVFINIIAQYKVETKPLSVGAHSLSAHRPPTDHMILVVRISFTEPSTGYSNPAPPRSATTASRSPYDPTYSCMGR
jgi:hypothetical protein